MLNVIYTAAEFLVCGHGQVLYRPHQPAQPCTASCGTEGFYLTSVKDIYILITG